MLSTRLPLWGTGLLVVILFFSACAPPVIPPLAPPAALPTATPVPPTATPVPPTATPVPLTATPVPPPTAAGPAALHLGWTWPDGDLQAQVAATAKDGTLYVMDSEGTLHALSAAGRELWKYHGDYGKAIGPWLSRDTQVLYIVTDRLDLAAVGADGAARWSRKLPEDAQSLKVAPDGAVLLATTDGGRRVTPDGKQEVPFTWPTPSFPSVDFDGRGRLYLPATGEIWVLSPGGEKERACPAKIMGFSETIAGLPDDGFVYADMEDDLVAVSSECRELWRYSPDGPKPSAGRGWGTLAVAEDGSLFAARNNGEIHALDASGKLLWRQTPSPDLGLYLVPGPDGAVFAAGSAGELAAFDRNGQQVWSRAPYYAGTPGPLVLSGDDGLATIQSGRLHFFAMDPAVMAHEPTAVPPPASVKAAETEIVAMLLDEAGCQGDAIAVWGPAEEGKSGVNTDAPLRVWWCQDGQWTEQPDMQAAITKAEKLNKEAGFEVRQYPVAYFEFGIISIADNAQEAKVYMGSTIGPLWGSGYEYTLRRRPSGQWSIVDSKMLWVS
jgi:outer membrane protein assembly factor BamB